MLTIYSSGSVNTASAPNSIQLNGSDGGGGGTKDTRYQISVPTAGTITFSWSYVTSDRDGPRYDPFGYYLNGTFVQLTNNGGANNQSGTKSISVSANDNFAFYIRSTDNVLGASTTVASNFTAVTQLCSNEYIRVRTWNFKDDCNNTSAFFTQTIHVKDNTAPVINTQASNSTVDCDGAGNTSTLNAWLANHGGAVATDACGGVTWSHNFTNLSNDCGATGSATVTFTVKDACGNKSTTTATFTIEDKTAPTIGTDAANSTVECDGSGNTSALNAWLASNGGASASDDCGGVTWSHNFTNLSDDCGATGSAEVTFTVKDACGNKSTTTATFTIVDKTAPIAICKAATITLVNGAASITADDINNGSYDVCSGGVTISASKTSFDCTNIGANTVTLTVTDACGNTSTCDATVTVVGKIPTLSISQGVQPVFCQGGAVVLSSSSNETVTYAWSNNATTANTSVYSSGTYSLTVTNSYGCTKSASTTVAYSQTDLLSSYTVLVTDEAEIEKESVVKSGGVGSTGTKGEVEVNESSLITASGTFAKAYEVEVKSGSSVTNAYSGTAVSVTLPTFAYNPYCDSKCSSKYHHHCSSSCSNNEHYHCKSSCNSSSHKHCSSSKCNYRDDVKVKKGATVTITDSIFKKIHIESDATVTFTSKNIYADEIETQKNVTIKFSGCTRIFLCKELKIHEDNVFNSANNSVIIYAEKKVDIKKGTTMNANVYTLEHFDTKGDKKSRNTLTGMYIAEKVHAHYTDFNWNTVCGSCGTMGKKSLEADLDGLRDASVDYVNVYPNPTNGLTAVSVSANSEAILKVKVINIAGEMLYSTEKTDFRGLAEIQIDMTTYAVGMYFIKVEYGNTTKIFKVNRLN